MNHLLVDAAKLGRMARDMMTGWSAKGRLRRAICVSRPNWPENVCSRVASFLNAKGVKPVNDFQSNVAYLVYLDSLLNDYARENPVVGSFPVADTVTLKRWEQRWALSRQHSCDKQKAGKVSHMAAA